MFTGKRQPVQGARPVKSASRLLFLELVGLEAKSNAQRLADYIEKRNNLERAA